jgi:uncharacterized protein
MVARGGARCVVLIVGLFVFNFPVRAQQWGGFGTCPQAHGPQYKDISIRSLYIPMSDGVRIAVDVVMPEHLEPEQKIPAILMMERYWRSRKVDRDIQVFFAHHGYAMVTGDSRGTGASFGIWRYHRNKDEVGDFGQIVSWIVAQPWSNGRVGGYGVSYSGNTADWIAQRNHPAVKAIAPRFPDFDPYTEEYFPGGLASIAFGQIWNDLVRGLDLNVKRGDPPTGVKPVDEDPDGRLLAQAIEQRKNLPDVYTGLRQITFRDDRPTTWGASMDDFGIYSHVADLQRSGVAIYSQASWFDAGTAQGILSRFVTLPNPQREVIGSWYHAGIGNADTFMPPKSPAEPSVETQQNDFVCFFDQYLKGIPNGMSGKLLIYYTLVENKWKSTKVWPPVGETQQRWYLAADHALSRKAPTGSDSGRDQYTVDFEVGNAKQTRWLPGGEERNPIYPDRTEQDRRLLIYTSAPLAEPIEITGNAVINLSVISTATDGAFIVYLEDVHPDGRVRYITEGELHALDRKLSRDRPPYKMLVPYHSFKRKDASPLVPGEMANLRFGLLPISVLIEKGHRLRIAIAGADKDTFPRIPEEGVPVLSVFRDKLHASYIELPVITRRQ